MTTEQLFNGIDLTDWRMAGPGAYDVVDGSLRTSGGMGLLWHTKRTLGNCRLRVVYRCSKREDNSGVFVRIDGEPPDPWHAVHHGYEVQIYDIGDEYHATGGIYSLSKVLAQPQKPPGEWNVMDIQLDGNFLDVSINNVLVTHFDPDAPVPDRAYAYEPERGPRPAEGYIGLQNHDAGSVVDFREVSVRPLDREQP